MWEHAFVFLHMEVFMHVMWYPFEHDVIDASNCVVALTIPSTTTTPR